MKILQYLHNFLWRLKPYEPGKPIEYVAREFGLNPKEIVKLASNENCLGPSPLAQRALQQAISSIHLYPDGGAWELKERLASFYQCKTEEIILGNGSNELLEFVAHAFLGPGRSAVMSQYAFVVYRLVSYLVGTEAIEAPADDNFGHDLKSMGRSIREDTRVIFICNPNNPTGTWISAEELEKFVERLPEDILVVLDEAYAELSPIPLPNWYRWIQEGRPVLITRTFSKAYGLAGLRIGYGIGPAPLIQALERVRQPFNCNRLAQVAALAALDDQEFLKKYQKRCENSRICWTNFCSTKGIRMIPSAANFCLVEVQKGRDCFDYLQRYGVIVRPMDSYGLPSYVRITFGTEEEDQRCQEVLMQFLNHMQWRR